MINNEQEMRITGTQVNNLIEGTNTAREHNTSKNNTDTGISENLRLGNQWETELERRRIKFKAHTSLPAVLADIGVKLM